VTCDLVDNEPYYKYYNYKIHDNKDNEDDEYPENEDDYERTSCAEFFVENSDFAWDY